MIRNLVAALSLWVAVSLSGTAFAVEIKGRTVPDSELPLVQAQCDTLWAREASNSNIEYDDFPSEAIVPSGNADRVKSVNLETLSVWDCRRAGLVH